MLLWKKPPSVLTETSKIKRYSLVLMLQLLMNSRTPHDTKFKKKSGDQAGINSADVFSQHHFIHLFFPFSSSEPKRHYLMRVL